MLDTKPDGWYSWCFKTKEERDEYMQRTARTLTLQYYEAGQLDAERAHHLFTHPEELLPEDDAAAER